MAEETLDSQVRDIEVSMEQIKKRLLTLEWDKKHNQLNAGMEGSVVSLKAKYKELEEQKAKLLNHL
jgi:hypothetical protein